MNAQINSLDMKNTIAFYESHPELMAPDVPGERANISEFLKLLPEAARERTIAKKVIFTEPFWFHRDSTIDNMIETSNKCEAISPTAIVPSKISYDSWTITGVPSADIIIRAIEPDAASDRARKIIWAEGLVHELAHSISQTAAPVEGYQLALPNGRVAYGDDLFLEFANLAENHAPISHYSSFLRDKDNKFNGAQAARAISEELAETIAAYQLGFAFCGDGSRSLNPFNDRPEVKEFISNFLNARLVRK